MSARRMSRTSGLAALGAAGVAYLLGVHVLMTRAPDGPWTVLAVLAPLLLAALVGAVRAGGWWLGVLLAACLVLLGAAAARGGPLAPQPLYLAQHAGVHLALALAFGASLRAGGTPVIAALAARVHRELQRPFTPAMATYTRRITLAWTLYFIAMAGVSVALFALTRFSTWAVFANLLTPLATGLMFAVEYWLRYQLHPEFERTSVADALRAYLRPRA